MPDSSPSPTPSLAAVTQRFSAWRLDNAGRRRRIPESLWHEAVALVPAHGVSRVSNTLRIDYAALKRRAAKANCLLVASPTSPTDFVEVGMYPSPPPSKLPDTHPVHQVEVIDHQRGRSMVIRTPSTSALGALVEAFYQGGVSPCSR